MLKSSGLRFLIVGVLTLLMFIPLGFIGDIVNSRSHYSEDTIQSLGQEWGGGQLFSGPQLIIPVQEDVVYKRKRKVLDPATGLAKRDDNDLIVYEYFDETVTEPRAPVFVYPDRYDLNINTQTQERHRGIFRVPVYTAAVNADFDMPTDRIEKALQNREVLLWDQAVLNVYVSRNRALRGEAVLIADGRELVLEPLANGQNGITAAVGDPRKIANYDLTLGANGAHNLHASAVGRTSTVTFKSDWPDPSFTGDFLPNGSTITDTGFKATWKVPHLARALPQIARDNPDAIARKDATMGVIFITPNDFYRKVFRSAEYGILFIALTFLTILLLDRAAARPAHPVQYVMVGLAQSVFVLLMLAFAEQIGFDLAYLGASGATIVLLVMFAATAMKMGLRTFALAVLLVVLYAVLYLILQSADYALLAGSTLAFVALAGTMILTRNEDWYGTGSGGIGVLKTLLTDPKPEKPGVPK